MRLEIVREGVVTLDSWLIEPGAITWDEDKEIVGTYGRDWDQLSNFIARVSDIRREDDGAITAEIEPLKPEYASLLFGIEADPEIEKSGRKSDLEPFIYANQVVEKHVGGIRHVFGCKLRAVTFFLKNGPGFPEFPKVKK